MDAPDSIRDAVVAFLRDECDLDPQSYTSSTPLFSAGVLDSFALVALLSFAEQHFGVALPLSDLAQETVDTVDALVAYVRTCAAARTA